MNNEYINVLEFSLNLLHILLVKITGDPIFL